MTERRSAAPAHPLFANRLSDIVVLINSQGIIEVGRARYPQLDSATATQPI